MRPAPLPHRERDDLEAEARVPKPKARFSIYPETQSKSDDAVLEVTVHEPVGRFLFAQNDMYLSRNAFCVTDITRTYVDIQYTNKTAGWVCRRDDGRREQIAKERPLNLTRMYNGDTLAIPGDPVIVGSSESVLKLALLAEDDTSKWDSAGSE